MIRLQDLAFGIIGIPTLGSLAKYGFLYVANQARGTIRVEILGKVKEREGRIE
jgi:hypothetical protein